MLVKTFSRALWDLYDALGRLVLANALWCALTLPWLGLLFAASLPFDSPLSALMWIGAIPVLFLNPASAGLAEMTKRLAETGETELSEFWKGFRTHFARSAQLMSVGALAAMGLASGVLFYGSGVWEALGKWGNIAAAGASVWAGLIAGAMGCWWMPVAVGVAGKAPRIGFILKRSALLTFDNPGFTFGVFAATVGASALLVGTGLGALFLWMSVVRTLHANARRTLAEKYEAADALRADGKTPTRSALRAALRSRWEREPKRGWKDLLRPWESERP